MITNFLSRQVKSYSQLFHDMNLKGIYHSIKDFSWQEYYADTKDKLKNLARTNYELALYHLNADHLSDAVLRFKITHFLDKNGTYTDTNYYIGLCYYEKFQYDKAKTSLTQHLTQDNPSQTEECDFLLKVIDNRSSEITKVPSSLISHKSDQMINTYGVESISNTAIPTQQQLLRRVNSYLQLHSKPFGNNILDLGCGTGTMGTLARELKLASFIAGVDISQSMIQVTQNAKVDGIQVYNLTVNSDITDYISTKSNNHDFDIIFASNSLGSMREIEKTLGKLAVMLAPKGVVAISFHTTEQKTPEFNPYIQQFTFNPKYVEKTAAAAKLKIYCQEELIFSNGDAGALMLLVKE